MIRDNLLKLNFIISISAIVSLLLFVFLFIFPALKTIVIREAEENSLVIAEHLSDMVDTGHDGKLVINEGIDELINSIMKRFPVREINIFTPRGRVIKSTREDMVGTFNREPEFMAVARTGRIYSEYSERGEKSLEGRNMGYSFVETFVPVLRDGKVTGIFEIYLDVSERDYEIKKIFYISAIILILLGGGLLAALIYSSRRADRYVALIKHARKEAERLSDMTFRILEKTPLGIFVIGEDRKIEYVNPAMLAISGARKEEFVGLRIMELPTYREIGLPERLNRVFTGEDFILGPVKYASYISGKETVRIFSGMPIDIAGRRKALVFVQDITEQKRREEEREQLIRELQKALSEVKRLSGLIPICASCKKIRDDRGYWKQVEEYIKEHSDAEFSHGICPECAEKLYPELYKKEEGA